MYPNRMAWCIYQPLDPFDDWPGMAPAGLSASLRIHYAEHLCNGPGVVPAGLSQSLRIHCAEHVCNVSDAAARL